MRKIRFVILTFIIIVIIICSNALYSINNYADPIVAEDDTIDTELQEELDLDELYTFDYDYKKIVPPRLHRFYEIIGKEKYEEVLEVYGGNPLYLNQKESYERELRNWNIYKDYKNGMEYFDLTSKYKLSVTTIRNITAQCQKKEKNGNNEEK